MTEVYLTDWDYSVAAEDISATYGTDPIATDQTQYGFVAGNQNFVQDAITSLDGRDVTGAGEEGGPPIIKALQRDFPLVIPRATPADVAWLAAFAMSGQTTDATPKDTIGTIDLTAGGQTPAGLTAFAMYPSEVPGEIKRTTLEAVQGMQGGRYLDTFVNSLQLRMDTGAQARSLVVNAGIILPSAVGSAMTQPVPPTGGASADLDGGSLRMRISKAATRLDTNWTTTANRDNQLTLADTVIAGTAGTDLFDVSGDMDYWQWAYNNNVDVDALFRFNTGLRMGRPRRGQRGQTLEIGVPRGLTGTDWPGDAEAGTVFAVELILQGVTIEGTGASPPVWHSGIRLIWPTCYLQSVPSYAKGPQEYQRLQFVPKEGSTDPTVWMDVFFKPYTATPKLAGVTAAISP